MGLEEKVAGSFGVVLIVRRRGSSSLPVEWRAGSPARVDRSEKLAHVPPWRWWPGRLISMLGGMDGESWLPCHILRLPLLHDADLPSRLSLSALLSALSVQVRCHQNRSEGRPSARCRPTVPQTRQENTLFSIPLSILLPQSMRRVSTSRSGSRLFRALLACASPADRSLRYPFRHCELVLAHRFTDMDESRSEREWPQPRGRHDCLAWAKAQAWWSSSWHAIAGGGHTERARPGQ